MSDVNETLAATIAGDAPTAPAAAPEATGHAGNEGEALPAGLRNVMPGLINPDAGLGDPYDGKGQGLGGLRTPGVRLVNKSNQVQHVTVPVGVGDEITVPAGQVAGFLESNSSFEDPSKPRRKGPVESDDDAEIDDEERARRTAIEEAGGQSARTRSGRR